MPDFDKYSTSTGSSGIDVSGSAFKPFSISDVASPYPYGQCTWYVYERVLQFDKHVDGHWGDAHNWDNSAEDAGYNVSTTLKIIQQLYLKQANLEQVRYMATLLSLKKSMMMAQSLFQNQM